MIRITIYLLPYNPGNDLELSLIHLCSWCLSQFLNVVKYSTNPPCIRSENTPFTYMNTPQKGKRKEKKFNDHTLSGVKCTAEPTHHMCQLLTTPSLAEVWKSQKLTVPAANFGRKLLCYTFFQTGPVLRPYEHNTSAFCGPRLLVGLSQLGEDSGPSRRGITFTPQKKKPGSKLSRRKSRGKATTRTKER